MARTMRAPNRFNDSGPKTINMQGSALDERGRNRSAIQAFKSVTKELEAHKDKGIEVEPIRRAKIAGELVRDHHRKERTTGRTRGIVKGKVG